MNKKCQEFKNWCREHKVKIVGGVITIFAVGLGVLGFKSWNKYCGKQFDKLVSETKNVITDCLRYGIPTLNGYELKDVFNGDELKKVLNKLHETDCLWWVEKNTPIEILFIKA